MSKVKFPLLGIGASGSLSDSLSFRSWRGKTIAETKPIPVNPHTSFQQGHRSIFRRILPEWSFISSKPLELSAWKLKTKILNQYRLPYNQYFSDYLKNSKNYMYFGWAAIERFNSVSAVDQGEEVHPRYKIIINFDIWAKVLNPYCCVSFNSYIQYPYNPHNIVWLFIPESDWILYSSVELIFDWDYLYFYLSVDGGSAGTSDLHTGVHYISDIPVI